MLGDQGEGRKGAGWRTERVWGLTKGRIRDQGSSEGGVTEGAGCREGKVRRVRREEDEDKG